MNHRTSSFLALVVLAATTGLAGCGSPTAPSASGHDPVTAVPRGQLAVDHRAGLGTAGGAVPWGVTAYDEQYPAVGRLDPALLDALQAAAAGARDDGVVLHVNSGWRSRAYQQRLLDDAVATYGSRAEAARWVATPDTSPHVTGDAVDIGDSEAVGWLADRGARFGLCQVYDNEPWHFEWRSEAVDDGCPERYDDPTDDPRMQQ